MDNFAPQLKQQGYTNQFREDYEFSVKQAGVSNEDLLGQTFTGAADITAAGYKIAEQHEAEAAKTAKEQNEERVRQAYNEFARKKMDIDRKAEQTQQWSRHDMETRMLINDFSKIKGVEAGKLFELSGKTDFTGAYSREKDTRKFWNDKNNEAKYKAVEAMRLANPALSAALTPEETLSITEAANDSIDSVTEYLSQLNMIDKNKNPSEYNRVKNNMEEALSKNIVSTALVEILNSKDSVNSSADLEAFRFNTIEKLVKKGIDRATASVVVEQSIKRSGMVDVVNSINNYKDFTSQDFERTIKYNVNMGKAYMGALDNMYSALMVSSDKWQAGEYFNEDLRIAGKTWNDKLGELAKMGSMSGLSTTQENRGAIYQGAVNILKSRVSASAKGHAIKAVFDDVEKTYADATAEERVQAYTEILKNFDNPYLDVNIQELLSSNKAEHRELGNILKQERERIINAKNMAVYEISGTPGAVALNQVKQGPGADLLRVNEDGQLVVIDGSKGFLQSATVTLTDMTGRYFSNVATFNTDFADKYKDAETRKKLLTDGGIPQLNPASETVIGRKEWYFSSKKSPEEVEIEKKVAALDEAWKGKIKTGEYWKQRRAIEAEQLGEPYDLADLPGDIVKGIGKGIITGAKGIGVGINRMLGNKTVWDKPEQELKGIGTASTTISTGFPRIVPANTESVDFSNEYEPSSSQKRNLGNYKEPDILYNTNIDLDIVSDIVKYIESSGNPDAVSDKGATGLMQLMPKTFEDIAKRYGLPSNDIKDPYTNTVAGQIYLAELDQRFNGDIDKVLSSYNAGPTKVNALIKEHGKNWRRYLPEETKNYLRKYYDILSKGAW